MKRFAALLDSLSREPAPAHKTRLLAAYFRGARDDDRAAALSIMRGEARLPRLRAADLRALAQGRVDAPLFELSLGFVGDVAETIALTWPGRESSGISLSRAVESLRAASKPGLPAAVAELLDGLDAASRLALLKLVTGGLKTAAAPREIKAAIALLSGAAAEDVWEQWADAAPPYAGLFEAAKSARGAACFRAPMRARDIHTDEIQRLDPGDFTAEYLWIGPRAQARADGNAAARLYSGEGCDISKANPAIVAALRGAGFDDVSLDANVAPEGLIVHDLLARAGEDLRALPLEQRRARLEALLSQSASASIKLSPLIPFNDFGELDALRSQPPPGAAGIILKRKNARYARGAARNDWLAWRRERFTIEAVLMYAERIAAGFELTFGAWRGNELIPVGKAVFDGDPARLEAWIGGNTINRFGPVREVARGLVLGVEFAGADRAPRRKAGLVLREARVLGALWDRDVLDACGAAFLDAMLPGGA